MATKADKRHGIALVFQSIQQGSVFEMSDLKELRIRIEGERCRDQTLFKNKNHKELVNVIFKEEEVTRWKPSEQQEKVFF